MNEENTQQVTSAIRTLVSAIIADIMGKIEPRLAALEQKIVPPAPSDIATISKMVDEVLDSALKDRVSEAIEQADIEDRIDTAIRRAYIEGKIADRVKNIDAGSLRPLVRDIINAATVKFDL